MNPYLLHHNDKKQSLPKKKAVIEIPAKEVPIEPSEFTFGNYKNYYGYRLNDSRLDHLNSDYFKGKILDIGCNSGILTLDVFKRYHSEIDGLLGVDLDPTLIFKAKTNLNILKSKTFKSDFDYFPISAFLQFGGIPIIKKDDEIYDEFSKVKFRCSDWVHEPFVGEKYNLIMAFSISKWIHLNNGDGGIRVFFYKVYDSLEEGGVFILEPQDWESYKKRSNISHNIRENFENIKFFPSEFSNFLVKKVGFKLIESFEVPHHFPGFKRQILVLKK